MFITFYCKNLDKNFERDFHPVAGVREEVADDKKPNDTNS